MCLIFSGERTKVVLVLTVLPTFFAPAYGVPWTSQVPKWTEDWIMHELGVLCDSLFGYRVNDPVAHFLDVNNVEAAIG
jgi:hypothetical protein